MRVLLWHVHGSWKTSFVHGDPDHLVPVTPARGSDGLGRAQTWDWPASVVEVASHELQEAEFDTVVMRRAHEPELVERWTGRRPGRDVPAVYVEHNPPGGMKVDELGEALGIRGDRLSTIESLPQHQLHRELARRRVYVHTSRWTSLGLSLLEAMQLGMPVVAFATTEAVAAVPPAAGVVTTRPEKLAAAVRRFLHDPSEARAVGAAARETALSHYGLGRFLADWDERLAAWAPAVAG